MKQNIKNTNIRFNLNKDIQRKAWNYLQSMDKQKFKSYSQAICISLVDYFDHYYAVKDAPYLETREREEQFVNQIVKAVEMAMQKVLPTFLAGYFSAIKDK